MSTGELAYLGLVLFVFTAFMCMVAYASIVAPTRVEEVQEKMANLSKPQTSKAPRAA
jgi:hypothetical protein